jgi:UDP-N-acetylglucosamine--N-acetylmuramyl-(pentapeptide) pyrophosphoryl-undecaprenol N-acetylglucosamine transferase
MKVIFSAGGTGGHIFPAIAVAQELKKKVPGIDILFVGAIGKMEMEKVPSAGFKIKGLWISGMQRKLTFKNLLFPVKLIFSLISSLIIIMRFKPDVIVAFGGFASGPVAQIGAWRGIPIILQEQNSYPGVTNKILSSKARKICVAYEGMERYFDKNKIIYTGNPVRQDITENVKDINSSIRYFGLTHNKKTVLVTGGSLGARTLNDAVKHNLESITGKNPDVQILWQVGKIYYEEFSSSGIVDNKAVIILPFIDRVDMAYAIADIVVARAGALTISELSISGKAVILVPSPNVAEDHQTKNAMNLVERNAAILLKDCEVREKLGEVINDLLSDSSKIKALSENILKLAKTDATLSIADIIVEEYKSKK